MIEPYDYDKNFPVFGFGGIPRHMSINSVSHCFALNGNPSNPEIAGIFGILEAYKANQRQIGLGGPTLFAPLLEQFLQYVKGFANYTVYQVLLILTDGAIHDMPRTKELVVELSNYPCSIIIVGVGNADFSAM